MRTPKLLVTLLVVGMAVTGCTAVTAAVPMKTIQPTPTLNASKALDTVPLLSLLPTAATASKGIGTSLTASEKPDSATSNTATPRPTDGLTRCELAYNGVVSAAFSGRAAASFNGADIDGAKGNYTSSLYRFKSDSEAKAFIDEIGKVGEYCPAQQGSRFAAWDSGIPESVGLITTVGTTSYVAALRKGKIVALGGCPSAESATKMLQLQIRTLASIT